MVSAHLSHECRLASVQVSCWSVAWCEARIALPAPTRLEVQRPAWDPWFANLLFQPLIHAVNGPAFASSFFSDANTGEVFICVVGYGAKVRTNSKIHGVYI